MKLKNIFIGMAMCSLFLTVSCQKEELTGGESGSSQKKMFFATLETPIATKTQLGEPVDGITPLLWSEGDQLQGLDPGGFPVPLFLAAGEGTSSASFALPHSGSKEIVAAVYPSIIAGQPKPESTPINVPQVQNYVKDNISMSSNIAVAKADGDKLPFKNVCGILNVQLTGTAKVTSITIKSDSALSGQGFLDRRTADAVLTMATNENGIKQVELKCKSGVQLSDEPTKFYIVVPPTDAKSFTMVIESSEGIMEYKTKESDKNVFIKGKILNMPPLKYVANVIKITTNPVISATSINFEGDPTGQSGAEIEKSFDGDIATGYHSTWSVEHLPITLTYKFDDAGVDIDAINYCYRENEIAGNGAFGEVEILVLKSDANGFEEVMTYDFEQTGVTTKISFPERQIGVKSVKIIVKTGVGGFAACAEMEFLKIETTK